MVAFASRARVSLAIIAASGAAAGATLAAALALPSRDPCADAPSLPRAHADDGMRLTAQVSQDPGTGELVVTVEPPVWSPDSYRAPYAAVLAIDRSKSMTGAALENTKAAARTFIANFSDQDAFAIVTYSDGVETLVPMAAGTAAHRARAERAIDDLTVDNGTCISCGIERAAAELARASSAQVTRRIVLLSDGRANLGLRDEDDLVQLAAEVARGGATISTVGVGDDHDATVMARIARVGGGAYRVATPDQIMNAFAREADELGALVATNMRLTLRLGPEIQIAAERDSGMIRTGDVVALPLPDLRAGFKHEIRLRTTRASAACPCAVVAEVAWTRPDGLPRSATALATAPRSTMLHRGAGPYLSTQPMKRTLRCRG